VECGSCETGWLPFQKGEKKTSRHFLPARAVHRPPGLRGSSAESGHEDFGRVGGPCFPKTNNAEEYKRGDVRSPVRWSQENVEVKLGLKWAGVSREVMPWCWENV